MSGEEADVGVVVAATDGILGIVIDRPQAKGSLTSDGQRAIIAALEAASTDDGLRAVFIGTSGADFCAGADWVATNSGGDTKPRPGSIQRRTPVQAHRLIALLQEIQLPVVSAVRGWAAGLGCQIALASDFVVASHDSRFWLPFVKRGFTPDSGASWLLPRLVGVARAKELLLLGRAVSGADAADWGMIHRSVPDDALDDAARDLVAELRDGPTVALGLTKRGINRGLSGNLADAMEAESMSLELSSRTGDFREGLAAFTERRDPDFQGR